MLIRYKRSYEKIAMGLLSFVPTEKDLKRLQNTIRTYEDSDDWQLFLWKEEDIIGIAGVELDESTAWVHHISVSPSHRDQGVGKRMVSALKERLGDQYHLAPTDESSQFLSKCNEGPIAEEG